MVEQQFEDVLEELTARFSRLSAAGDVVEPDRWTELAAAEALLWQALIRGEAQPPTRDNAAGHPLAAPARRWRRALLEQGLAGEAQGVNDVLDVLHAQRMESWRERNDPRRLGGDPDAWFARLRVTDRLARAALESPRAGDGREELEAARRSLREGLRAALEKQPPDAHHRRAWSDTLVDVSSEALALADDLPPTRSAQRLESLSEQLTWHLENVEPAGGERHTRLRRRRRRLNAEATERRLTARLESLFGARLVALWERSILYAILLVLGLMLAPLIVSLTPAGERRLLLVDSALCGFFLVDFFVKWSLTRGDRTWFLRHFLTDLLPALPFPLLFLGAEGAGGLGGLDAQEGRGVLVLRFLRLSRLARYSRVLLPLLRAARVVGFLLRGLDRMVRRFGRGLDFDVILHPTPAERRRARAHGTSPVTRLWRLLVQAETLWSRTLAASPQGSAAVAAARLPVLAQAAELPWRTSEDARPVARQDVCADDLLDRLSAIPAEEIEGELGTDFVARVARNARAVARSPLRWLPLMRAYVPSAPDGVGDAELCARLTRGAAARLRAHLDRMRWGADLYGTMTPSDLVGRVGATLVRRTARPVVRMLMLAAAYLVVVLLFRLFDLERLEMQLFGKSVSDWANRLGSLLGTTLFIVAGVCFLLLAIGFWLQRLASDASTYYAQVASAQFLHLTESIKVRQLERDAVLFERRVFAPERELRGELRLDGADQDAFLAGVRGLLTLGAPVERSRRGFDPVARSILLYRDVLDGGLLGEGDTRTTSQLLGNLALKRLRGRSWRVSAADGRALDRLDLVHRRSLVGGPWMWFNLIARATTQQAARLIVDYNEHALPLEELTAAAPEVSQRYERWLTTRSASPEDLVTEDGDVHGQLTTAFTALHFLDDAPERDEAIEARFGPEVLALVRRDRRALFRRVFGTYPLHLRARDGRVLNLRHVYRRRCEGGRALLLPLQVTGLGLRQLAKGTLFLGQAVRRVRDHSLAHAGDPRAESDFTTAARKIDRMRGPAALACTWQRVLADVEYLGVPLPGHDSEGFHGSCAEADLDFLAAPYAYRERVRRERSRAAADVRRLEGELERDLWGRIARAAGTELEPTGARLRALVVAYRADYQGLRTKLSAEGICSEVFATASREPALAPRVRPRFALRRAFAAWWEEHGSSDRTARLRCWRAAEHDVDGVAAALLAWHRIGPEEARARGERALIEVLRHPGQITEQVVTLRAVQTLALIDLRNYREHVWRLGGFAEDGEEPDRAFRIAGEDTGEA